MKIDIRPNPNRKNETMVFINFSVKEALSQIESLAAQIRSQNPNTGRQEITYGNYYLSMTVTPANLSDK